MLPSSQIILRLVLAAVLGGIVGMERERLEWAAGLRTHMLVCLGSALVMIVSAFGFADILGTPQVVLDPSRVAAQVVSGIGFLGAGTILFLRQEVIRGLTTAASLWTVAAVGLAVGSGLFLAAIFSTVFIVVILAILKPVENYLFHRRRNRRVLVIIDHGQAPLLKIEDAIKGAGLSVQQITLKRSATAEEDNVQFTLEHSASNEAILAVVEKLRGIAGVREVQL